MMNHDIKNVYFKETIIPVNEKHIMSNKPSFTLFMNIILLEMES